MKKKTKKIKINKYISNNIDKIKDKILNRPSLTEEEREEKFENKMRLLDEKANARRLKKKHKIEKRSQFLYEHKKLYYLWNIIKVIVILLIIGGILFMGTVAYNLYDDYNNSVKWTKISGPKEAEQSVDLLYSSASDKKVKSQLNELINNIWDSSKHEFKSVNDDDINKLKDLYNKAKAPKDDYTKIYNEIVSMYEAKQSLLSVFTDENFETVKKSATLQNISDTVDLVFDKIDDYLIKGNNYEQANNYKDVIYKLANDANTYSSVLSMFMSNYNLSLSKNKLDVNTKLNKKDYTNLSNTIDMLSFKYEMIDKFIKPIMNKSKKSIDNNTKNESDYAAYQEDVNNQNNFNYYYEQYTSIYNNAKSLTVDYIDFTGKTIKEVEDWAALNDIKVTYNEQASEGPAGVILKQTPSYGQYTSIIKGSSITVTVSKTKITTSSSSSNKTNNSSSKSSSTYSSSNSSNLSSSNTELSE